jgi:hypothetical protein
MDKPRLTRRRVLAAVGAAGAAIGGAGLLTEPSLTYADTTAIEVESGTLEVDWRETYTTGGDQSILEDTLGRTGEFTSEGAVISLGNVLPGDAGTLSFRLTNISTEEVNPQLSLNLERAAENGINEPEEKAGDTSTDGDPQDEDFPGELQNDLDASLWEDTGILGIDSFGADNATNDLGEPNIADGTLKTVAGSVNGYSLGPLPDGGQVSVAFSWQYTDDGAADINQSQGDSVTFGFELATPGTDP